MTEGELQSALRAYRESRVLLTALELDVFTALREGATAAEAAARTGAAPRAVELLLNALTAMELIGKAGGVYRNSPLAARLLDGGAPESARAGLLHEAERWHSWSRLTAFVRGEVKAEARGALPPAQHAALLALLDRKAAVRAPKLLGRIGVGGVRRVLDLGGGSAAYSIALVRAAGGAVAEILELPGAAPITRDYIARAGEQHRVSVREGDLLSDGLGSGFDLILLFSLTHLFSAGANRELLARCRRALAPGGRLAIHDHVLTEDKTSPREGAFFALNMLVATAEGGTYALGEYRSWLHDAGFTRVEHIPLEGEPTSLLIAGV